MAENVGSQACASDGLALPTLSIVSPCYNEEEVIGQFYDAITLALQNIGCSYELILVDDGSKDGTLDVLNQLAAKDDRVQVYSLSRNFGHQIAITAGLDAARGDAVIMMDSDLQHPPEMIPQLLDLWQQGNDVVSTVRRHTQGASLFKRWSSDGFYWILNALSETRVVPGAADFCLLSRRACVAVKSMPERHRFLRGIVSWIGYRRVFVDYHASQRAAGHSKYTLAKMLRLAFDATFSFSVTPIKMATRLGLGISTIGFLYLVYVLVQALRGGAVQGWPSLISVVLILGGLQLAFVGLIGAYVGRIFEEVKRRPVYLLKQAPSHVTT